MAKAKIENLMTELHERFGEVPASAQQELLLQELQARIEGVSDSDSTTATPMETAELMLESLGEEHPNVTALLRELLDTLKNIGV